MITNDEIQLSKMSYTDKDFASIYPDLLDLAKQLTNKWDPSLSNESDPGVVLLKEGAFIADHNNYNIDKNVLENFLPSATQDRSVRNLMEINGYTPRYYVSATGNLNFTFHIEDLTNFIGFTIPAYTLVVTNNDEDIAYTQVEDLNINNVGVNASCKFMEGTLNQLTVNNEGAILLENLDEYNRVYFPDPYVAENGVFIYNKGNNPSDLWKRNNYLLTQPIGSKVYKVDFDSRVNLPYVEFPGDIANIIGNGLIIKYISTSGTLGNVNRNELIKIKSPTTFYVDRMDLDVNLNESFTVSNPSSIKNGKDPETINEMYQSFKRIVGTFDTLVTRRDYSNAIFGLRDSYDENYVSNDVVTDIKTDYNNAINILTYDEYGAYYENASLNTGDGIYRYNFVTSQQNPVPGNIYISNTGALLYNGNEWTPIQELSYRDFVTASESMAPYDLCIHALRAFSMADYSDSSPGDALNLSFTPADRVTVETIKSALNDYKCINHVFRDLKGKEIFCFKNYVPLNITIIPYSKINSEVDKNEIIENIYRALSEHFNAREVEFGEELNYDEVVDVLLNADSRIKNIRLEDFQYEPHVMYADGTETELYYSKELLVDLIAKNVLAGRMCLFNFDESFTYGYGQVNTDLFGDVARITTETNIPVVPPESTSTIEVPETIESEPTSFGEVGADIVYLSVIDPATRNMVSASELTNGSTSVIEIMPGQSYTITGNYLVRVEYDVVTGDDTSEPTILDVAQSVENQVTVDIKNIGDTSEGNIYYRGDGIGADAIPAGSLKIIKNNISPNAVVEQYDFQYTLKDNEFIEIAYPNYHSSIIYPTYCNYRFISGLNTTVFANTDYTLEQSEYLYIMYTKDNVEQSITYGPGTVINTTFNLSPTGTFGARKKFGTNGTEMIFGSLSAGQQIAIREKLETNLQNTNTPCYWIRNNNGNVLFKETEVDNLGKEGYSWVILNSGEYFIYSNTTLDYMVILGAGTKISRSLNDGTQWAISTVPINIESINNNGFNSNINWQYKDFSQNSLTFQEMNLVVVGSGDTVSIANWSDKPSALNNEWSTCAGVITYTNNENTSVLKQLNTEDGYLVRSRLDLVTDNYNGQRLYSGNGSTQSITLTYYDEETGSIREEVISPVPASSESSDEVNTLYLQSSIPMDSVGGENINIELLTANNTLNFMSYDLVKPVLITGDLVPMAATDPIVESYFYYLDNYSGSLIKVKGEDLLEAFPGATTFGDIDIYTYYSESEATEKYHELTSIDGKYVVTMREAGRLEFPFSYENTFSTYDEDVREYILPIFLVTDDGGVPVTARFEQVGIENTIEPIYIMEYNKGEPTETVTLDTNNLYLLTPVISSGLESSEIDSSEAQPIETINVKANMKLILEWNSVPDSTEIITVYEPKIATGINSNLGIVDNSITLHDVLGRIDDLVSNSSKPNVKPYYINEPEPSVAIQDPDIFNPNIFWDKNNVANIITIPQIIIPSENIDIIKSMKGYSLKGKK